MMYLEVLKEVLFGQWLVLIDRSVSKNMISSEKNY